MSLITEHYARTLDQEIDAIEICPACPDYLVVATYSLVQKHIDSSGHVGGLEETGSDKDASQVETSRIGSIQILPFDWDVLLPELKQQHNTPAVARYDLPCAILDIHFHPADETLLGVSTSSGELWFFHSATQSKMTASNSQSIEINLIGNADLTSEGSDGVEATSPLITQFQWLDSTSQTRADSNRTYYLASSDTSGQIKLVKVHIPSATARGSPLSTIKLDAGLPCTTYLVHEHLYSLEAWTVALIPLNLEIEELHYVLLSGGDDSCFILSTCKIPSQKLLQDRSNQETTYALNSDFDIAPNRVYLDKDTHMAGVVSILPLPLLSVLSPGNTTSPLSLILTGSYDQYARLWLFDPVTRKPKLISDFRLEGGVWRIVLLDTYVTQTGQSPSTRNYILLISSMHSGCYIVRLAATVGADGIGSNWNWTTEARFLAPHESMVYACAAKRLDDAICKDRRWKIASTSFYDKRLCVWQWIDPEYQEGGPSTV